MSFLEVDDRAAIQATRHVPALRLLLLLPLLCGILSVSGCIGLTGAANSSGAPKTPVPAAVSVSPASVNFGSVAIGGTASESVTIMNPTGSNISVTQASTDASGVTIPGATLPLSIGPGRQSTLNIVFSPKHAGAVAGTVSVMSNAASQPYNVSVAGTGVSTQTLLNASTSGLNFGTVAGGASSALSVSLTNAGNSNVTISRIQVAGGRFAVSGLSPGTILAPGQNAALDVIFSAPSVGTLNGSVTVTSNASNSPAVINLAGTGASPSSHTVALAWQPDPAATSGYNVYRSADSGGPYSKVNPSEVTATAYTDSSLQGGQIYFYVVTAVNTAGFESSPSVAVSAAIPSE